MNKSSQETTHAPAEKAPAARELFLEKTGSKSMTYETGLSLEERVASMFQPDTLLPAQYLETFRKKAHLEPGKRLMLAVLEDAIACFQKYLFARDGRGRTLFREAEEWVLERDSDWLFSFASACELLGMNPQYVREGLMRWKKAKLAAQPKAKICHLYPVEEKTKPTIPRIPSAKQDSLRVAVR